MLILWIRKSKTGEQTCPQKNDKDSFQKHDEDMKKFRLAHPDIEAISPRDIMTARWRYSCRRAKCEANQARTKLVN